MITSVDCYRCVSRMYNKSSSHTWKNGSFFEPEKEVGGLRYAGNSLKDRVCMGSKGDPCVEDFEFFLIKNDSSTRSIL